MVYGAIFLKGASAKKILKLPNKIILHLFGHNSDHKYRQSTKKKKF